MKQVLFVAWYSSLLHNVLRWTSFLCVTRRGLRNLHPFKALRLLQKHLLEMRDIIWQGTDMSREERKRWVMCTQEITEKQPVRNPDMSSGALNVNQRGERMEPLHNWIQIRITTRGESSWLRRVQPVTGVQEPERIKLQTHTSQEYTFAKRWQRLSRQLLSEFSCISGLFSK